MKPDTGPGAGSTPSVRRLDAIERAHLKDAHDTSHAMYRYAPPPEFDGFLQRFWIPVWSVPPGEEAPQNVLQYPVCLFVITAEYARFYGVASGLSTTTLTGDGWAVGVMLAPAAGHLIAGGPVAAHTDRFVELSGVFGDECHDLVERVRAVMAVDPHAAESHRVAMETYASVLRRYLPVDAEGEVINRLVDFVESNGEVLRVTQLCREFGMTERTLQRLVHRRLGLTPKWLIQRRRLQEAAELLRQQQTTAAEMAAMLGYADQAHFIRDFSAVTAMTPGQFAALHH